MVQSGAGSVGAKKPRAKQDLSMQPIAWHSTNPCLGVDSQSDRECSNPQLMSSAGRVTSKQSSASPMAFSAAARTSSRALLGFLGPREAESGDLGEDFAGLLDAELLEVDDEVIEGRVLPVDAKRAIHFSAGSGYKPVILFSDCTGVCLRSPGDLGRYLRRADSQ